MLWCEPDRGVIETDLPEPFQPLWLLVGEKCWTEDFSGRTYSMCSSYTFSRANLGISTCSSAFLLINGDCEE